MFPHIAADVIWSSNATAAKLMDLDKMKELLEHYGIDPFVPLPTPPSISPAARIEDDPEAAQIALGESTDNNIDVEPTAKSNKI